MIMLFHVSLIMSVNKFGQVQSTSTTTKFGQINVDKITLKLTSDNHFDVSLRRITQLADPVHDLDAVNKSHLTTLLTRLERELNIKNTQLKIIINDIEARVAALEKQNE